MTASGAPSASPTAAVFLAQAGWMAVSEDILAGLCHDLSNRAASLEGLLHLLAEGSSEMLGQVSPEVERLGGSVAGLRALLGNLEAEPEPLLVSDVVTRVQELHRIRRSLGMVTVECGVAEGLPPVLANPTRLARTLLILLDEVASATLQAGGDRVLVEVTGSPDEVWLSIGGRTEAERYLKLDTADALRGLITPAGWTLAEDPGSVLLSLPSLARARAMEEG